ncbi:MAG: hypothetical protein WC701_00225 [Kiritimatiellales bacterium]
MKKDKSTESLPRPARRRLWTVLLMLGIFTGGTVLGSALTVSAIVHRMREAAREPEKAVDRTIARMDKYLHLTGEQKTAVQTIVSQTTDDLRVLQARSRMRGLMRLQAARLEINKLLTPEQVQKLDERFERLRKLWNPSSSGTEQ